MKKEYKVVSVCGVQFAVLKRQGSLETKLTVGVALLLTAQSLSMWALQLLK